MIVTSARSARSSASALLPLAVGPAMSASGGRSGVFIATIVAADGLTEQSLVRALPGAGAIEAVEARRVYRVALGGDPHAARQALETLHADVFVRRADAPGPQLLVADMDSTMITVECIDELAD